jgi:hypothetical protein
METPKKEWKWPMGILAAYLVFVTATLGFVAFTFTVHFDLVTPDYYEKTMVYQQQIDSESNAMSLEHPLEWILDDGDILLVYPPELLNSGLQGAIVMYRPSDASLDLTIPVEVDTSGVQRISGADLRRGLWEMQVRWTSDGISYFSKADVFLPN